MSSLSAAVPGTTCPCCPSHSGLTPPPLVQRVFTVCVQKAACPSSLFFSLVWVEGRGFFFSVFSFFFLWPLCGACGMLPRPGTGQPRKPQGQRCGWAFLYVLNNGISLTFKKKLLHCWRMCLITQMMLVGFQVTEKIHQVCWTVFWGLRGKRVLEIDQSVWGTSGVRV